ncbi:MAG: DUF368 domain-containing protein [Myxococcota bacterium]|nr:DUF368 domain-containing protein [Myxococcota bacterium]
MKDTPKQNEAKTVSMIGFFLRGFAMGAADVVPGVSGGTIAFITGIYTHFINALRSASPALLVSLIKGQPRAALAQFKAIHWGVLIPVGAGVGLAVLALSKTILGLMDDQPGPTYALFFGLILASVWIPYRHMKKPSGQHLLAGVLAAAFAWFFVGLQPDGIQLRAIDGQTPSKIEDTLVFYGGKLRHPADLAAIERIRQTTFPNAKGIVVFDPKGILSNHGMTLNESDIAFKDKGELKEWIKSGPAVRVLAEQRVSPLTIFFYGLIAISAMVLPGLSGSFLLLFLGVYHSVFTAIHQCKDHLLGLLGRTPDPVTLLNAGDPLTDLLFLGCFGLGVVVGLVTFSRVVALLFERAHDVTMALLIGLMVGALRLPGTQILEQVDASQTGWTTVSLVALVGVIAVVALNSLDRRDAN